MIVVDLFLLIYVCVYIDIHTGRGVHAPLRVHCKKIMARTMCCMSIFEDTPVNPSSGTTRAGSPGIYRCPRCVLKLSAVAEHSDLEISG